MHMQLVHPRSHISFCLGSASLNTNTRRTISDGPTRRTLDTTSYVQFGKYVVALSQCQMSFKKFDFDKSKFFWIQIPNCRRLRKIQNQHFKSSCSNLSNYCNHRLLRSLKQLLRCFPKLKKPSSVSLSNFNLY